MPGGRRPVRLLLGGLTSAIAGGRLRLTCRAGALLGAGGRALGGSAGLFGPCGSPSCH